ncbi:hypothetical protein QQ056_03460 [Oscillatoria laete-virens NRMC-F 0139]|nr:hypothetical protein [Oscillatoria laete-virens]MDL5052619.1 hypothetical protein [Oscillatoria laete-virens NRMC-F 0139]
MSKGGAMFSLTKQEQILIAVILSAGLLGGLVMIWRGSTLESRPIPEEKISHEEDQFQ